jgi:hypothetical protein
MKIAPRMSAEIPQMIIACRFIFALLNVYGSKVMKILPICKERRMKRTEAKHTTSHLQI